MNCAFVGEYGVRQYCLYYSILCTAPLCVVQIKWNAFLSRQLTAQTSNFFSFFFFYTVVCPCYFCGFYKCVNQCTLSLLNIVNLPPVLIFNKTKSLKLHIKTTTDTPEWFHQKERTNSKASPETWLKKRLCRNMKSFFEFVWKTLFDNKNSIHRLLLIATYTL